MSSPATGVGNCHLQPRRNDVGGQRLQCRSNRANNLYIVLRPCKIDQGSLDAGLHQHPSDRG